MNSHDIVQEGTYLGHRINNLMHFKWVTFLGTF
jgi:hypothetical protein